MGHMTAIVVWNDDNLKYTVKIFEDGKQVNKRTASTDSKLAQILSDANVPERQVRYV